jgi:hypothetical protein
LYLHLPSLFFFYIPELFGSIQDLLLKADEFLILLIYQSQGLYQVTIENFGSFLGIFFALQGLIQKNSSDSYSSVAPETFAGKLAMLNKTTRANITIAVCLNATLHKK